MRWREVLFNALLTLIVTIIGGIGVWFFTKAPPPPAEQLCFSVEEGSTFESEHTRIGIVTVQVSNTGDKAAKSVELAVNFLPGIIVRDKKIMMSSGPSGVYQEKNDKGKQVDLVIPTLAPKENITVTLLVSGSLSFTPKVGVKSSDSVGIEAISMSLGKTSGSSYELTQFRLIDLGLMVGLIVLLLWMRRRLSRRLRGAFPSVNNTAFLYLQLGLVKEAKRMLFNKVSMRGADGYEMANLALAVGLAGDLEGAECRFVLCDELIMSNHGRAVVLYNRATLDIQQSKFIEGVEKLEAALKLSPKEIRDYLSISTHFEKAAKDNENVCTTIKKLGVEFKPALKKLMPASTTA